MEADARRALRPIVPVARATLRDMDPDRVPQRLRRVVASSARTLPPPLERSLIEVLEDDASFRAAVAERWQDDGDDSPIVSAFLDDPASVATDLASLATQAESERAAAREEELRVQVASMADELEEAKARLVELRTSTDAELKEVRAADKRARASLERQLADAKESLDRAHEHITGLQQEIADRDAEIASLESRLDRLRSRTPVAREVIEERQGGGLDPAGIADELDDRERRLRPYRGGARSDDIRDDDRPRELPPGLAPDTPEVVDALADLGIEVLIDGYNVGGRIGFEGFSEREGRERVVTLGRMLARAGCPVTVVFDARDVEGRERFEATGGVTVRFSSGQTADDFIVAEAHHRGGAIAVITNDRELRERSAAEGAVVVWSDALIAWAERV